MSGASAVTLHGNSQTNRNLARINGLIGPPAPRDITRVRPWTDGAIDQTVNLGERMITLEGELWQSTGGAALVDVHTISEAFTSSLLNPAKLTVTFESGEVRWCNVKLAGAVDVAVEGSSRMVNYQVTLRAADPRLYSTTLKSTTLTAGSGLTFVSTANAVNAGTASSPLTIVVNAGASSSLTVSELYVGPPATYASLIPQTYTSSLGNPSMSIVGTGTGFSVPANTSRTFYTATRTASSLASIDSQSEFPVLYPGTSTVGVLASASSVVGASCVFNWYDAYL
jgi:hypothetical protein